MSKSWKTVVALLWIAIAAVPWLDGIGYYRLSPAERPFSALYELYRPAGLVGQGLGILGSLMIMLGVVVYSLRKRLYVLHGFGKLRSWLTFHIFLCTLGPYLVLLHTTFKIGNIAAIAFWSMAVVVASGIFGRYVYQHIPKGADGVFFGTEQLLARKEDLVARVSSMTGQSRESIGGVIGAFAVPAPRGLLAAVWATVRFDIGQRRLSRQLVLALDRYGVDRAAQARAVPILVDGLRLDHSYVVSGPMQRLFGYWHVLHIPLAIVMLITLLVHVGVAIAFGYTWIF